MKKTIEEKLKNMKIEEDSGTERVYREIIKLYNSYIEDSSDSRIFWADLSEKNENLIEKLQKIYPINQKAIQKLANFIDKKLFSEKDVAYYVNEKVIAVAEDYGYKEGIFLTKIIESNDLEKITIKLDWGWNIHFFGFKLSKNKLIRVNGDIGQSCGEYMETGKIIIKGSARKRCGADMKGGDIEVMADVESIYNDKMRGGTLKIYGNIGYDGTIYNGKGKIYHKDRLIHPIGYEGTIYISARTPSHW